MGACSPAARRKASGYEFQLLDSTAAGASLQ
jgi:hypothetical protein